MPAQTNKQKKKYQIYWVRHAIIGFDFFLYTSWRQCLVVHEDKDGLFRRKFDAFANDIHKLPNLQFQKPHMIFQMAVFSLRATRESTVKSDGTRYFFLSMSGMSLFGAFSAITCGATKKNKRYSSSSITIIMTTPKCFVSGYTPECDQDTCSEYEPIQLCASLFQTRHHNLIATRKAVFFLRLQV